MKKLMITTALAMTALMLGAKTIEEQYAEAKAKNHAGSMLYYALQTTNSQWKAEAVALGDKILSESNPNIVDNDIYEHEGWYLIEMINLGEKTKDECKKWIVEQRLANCYYWFNMKYDDDSSHNISKKLMKVAQSDNYRLYSAMATKSDDCLIEVCSYIDFANVEVRYAQSYLMRIAKLDVSYRTDEVTKILKNMNQVYTLKMYEDGQEATYKPLVTKIRAMIEIR